MKKLLDWYCGTENVSSEISWAEIPSCSLNRFGPLPFAHADVDPDWSFKKKCWTHNVFKSCFHIKTTSSLKNSMFKTAVKESGLHPRAPGSWTTPHPQTFHNVEPIEPDPPEWPRFGSIPRCCLRYNLGWFFWNDDTNQSSWDWYIKI